MERFGLDVSLVSGSVAYVEYHSCIHLTVQGYRVLLQFRDDLSLQLIASKIMALGITKLWFVTLRPQTDLPQ